MTRCAGITRSGSRCTQSVSGAQEYCHHHDPARAEARRRAASKAGRSKADGELTEIRELLKRLTDEVLATTRPTGVAVVANQLLNSRLRAVEVARRLRETDELEERLEAIEGAIEDLSAMGLYTPKGRAG